MTKRPDVYLELAHGYATLDHGCVYDIATQRVFCLVDALRDLIAQYPEGD